MSGLRTLPICKTLSDFLGTSGGPPWGDAATCSSEWKLCWPSASPTCGGKARGSAPEPAGCVQEPRPAEQGELLPPQLPTGRSFAVPSSPAFSVPCEPPGAASCREGGEGSVGARGAPPWCSPTPPNRPLSSPLASVSVAAPLQPCEEGMGGWRGTLLPGAGLPPSCSRWGARKRSAASASGAAGRAGSRGWCSGRAPPASRPAACSPSCPGPAGALGTPGERVAQPLGAPRTAWWRPLCPPHALTISGVWFHDGHRPLPRSRGRVMGWGRLPAGCRREVAAG